LDVEAVNMGLIGRMLTRVCDEAPPPIEPPGRGRKTFLTQAAIRRKYSVHAERADKLFKRLRAAQLDHTTTTRYASCTASTYERSFLILRS
jgi:hypothetical protein